jgi:hypothetical protein
MVDRPRTVFAMEASRCEPPPHTPAGTVCVLEKVLSPANATIQRWTWNKFSEWWRPSSSMTPEYAGQTGWRFVRVVENDNGK